MGVKMINFITHGGKIFLEYSSSYEPADWVDEKMRTSGEVTFRRTFTVTEGNRVPLESVHVVDLASSNAEDDEEEKRYSRQFEVGSYDDEYFSIDKDVLGIKRDLLISRSFELDTGIFVANREISIVRRIDDLTESQIIVGGSREGAIPEEHFRDLLIAFPSTTELKRYAQVRVHRVLADYLQTKSDPQEKLEKYLAKRPIKPKYKIEILKNYELRKFVFIRDEVREMLAQPDAYRERDWQNKIIEFVLLIFPKYIAVLDELRIKDFYFKPGRTVNRRIDLALVDANGNIDVIEIKKPVEDNLISSSQYRENYTPRRELSGSVMQVEKYIFHLNKWGRSGEEEITKARSKNLPSGLAVKITNPKGIIILGRDKEFTAEQKFDFEIIKRKYGNVIDIMTYDDLLRRLDNIIAMMSR